MSTTLGLASPVDLIAAQVDCERLAYPTGAQIFSSGQRAASIYGVRQGLVELIDEFGNRLCYRPGEVFSYQDIAWREGHYRNNAVARTPVELVKLGRLHFLNLLHNHPTMAVMLISQQHDRLREQRNSGNICY
ncbi:MAG: Crp/Fnr family transcriptional regulator [Cyanobacteria bacterium]|nr:Crp/Fnr family transcriptional regulator [Cyanobacteriota bacterium]